jgi:heme O synthase-like polyprenyltransferase
MQSPQAEGAVHAIMATVSHWRNLHFWGLATLGAMNFMDANLSMLASITVM